MNLLISYPRSGNTWLRYCVEFLAKKPTVGYTGTQKGKPIMSNFNIKNSKPPLLKKLHTVDEQSEKASKVILVLRNYKECIPRHVNLFSCEEAIKKSGRISYLDLLYFYDNFNGEKIIIYYEDLMLQPKEELKKLLSFLKESEDFLEEFIENFEYHKKQSISFYNKGESKSQTEGNAINYQTQKMTQKQIVDWDIFLKKYMKKYLINT